MTTHSERVRQTRALIVDALVTIGQKKPLNQITVSDLTRTSGISRGTFYLHYLDKDDFVTKIENGIADDLRTILASDIGNAMNYQQLISGEPYDVVVKIVRIAAQNRSLITFLFGSNGDPSFYVLITEILQEAIVRELVTVKGSATFSPDLPPNYALRLVINTIMSVITTWLASGDNIGEEEVCALIMRALILSPYDILDLNPTSQGAGHNRRLNL